MTITSTTFIISAREARTFPADGLQEFAFVGRSNAGKSTLLNKLTASTIAKTSSTPGKTRLINFFHVDYQTGSKKNACIFTDLPGYGFAVHGDERSSWEPVITQYIRSRSVLRAVILLLDARHFILPNDAQAVEWLESAGKDFVVGADKVR